MAFLAELDAYVHVPASDSDDDADADVEMADAPAPAADAAEEAPVPRGPRDGRRQRALQKRRGGGATHE